MSRAGKKSAAVEGPPAKPDIVQTAEHKLLEQRAMIVYGRCAHKLRGHIIPMPEIHGALIANNVMNQIMRQMIMAQSKIVVPRPEVVRPK